MLFMSVFLGKLIMMHVPCLCTTSLALARASLKVIPDAEHVEWTHISKVVNSVNPFWFSDLIWLTPWVLIWSHPLFILFISFCLTLPSKGTPQIKKNIRAQLMSSLHQLYWAFKAKNCQSKTSLLCQNLHQKNPHTKQLACLTLGKPTLLLCYRVQ